MDSGRPAAASPGPGWYPDPYGTAPLRWWDGTKWEAHVAGGSPALPAAPMLHPVAARRPLPPETPVHTPWVWLVLLLPLLNVLASLATLGTVTASLGTLGQSGTALSSPGYVISFLLGWVVLALTVVFSWLDYGTLERRGVDRPFHWAWSFLAWPVYTIGRAVIVRRVAEGRGTAVLWASIAVLAVSIAAGAAAAIILTSAILQSVQQLPAVGV
jgi:hypothetical protein